MTEYVLSVAPGTPRTGKHDPAAALFRDGKLVYGAEEERFTREKHAQREFPHNSIESCLDHCGIGAEDLDRILVPWKIPRIGKRKLALGELFQATDSIGEFLLRTERELESRMIARLYPKSEIRSELERYGEIPEIKLLPHHRCHAAAAFHGSGRGSALVLTVDGEGELESTAVWDADRGSGLEKVKEYSYRNSLGIFYAAFTEFLGFRPFNGEGKVMGLAAYGDPNSGIREVMDEIFQRGADYDVRTLCTRQAREGGAMEILEERFGRERRQEGGDIADWHRDLAYEVQKFLEDTVVDIVETFSSELERENICIAGGVGLNCKMNQRIREIDRVENIHPFPVAHDAGNTIGAGMLHYSGVGGYTDVYLGDSYPDGDVEGMLRRNSIPFTECTDVPGFVAESLADGLIVGHFNGRMEMGPRALGNRSILADPRDEGVKERLNSEVKFREDFRPFAPTVLEERMGDLVADAAPSPHMVQTFALKEAARGTIPAASHVDGTVRPQTVTRERNPRLYRIVKRFEEETGVPAVLNTSLNTRGEPIVNSPVEALQTFYSTGMDALVLNRYVIEKQGEDR